MSRPDPNYIKKFTGDDTINIRDLGEWKSVSELYNLIAEKLNVKKLDKNTETFLLGLTDQS